MTTDPIDQADIDQYLAPRSRTRAAWCHFDHAWYLLAYPEIRGELADESFATVRRHYLEFGRPGGLSPNMLFDEAWYLLRYPEVAAEVARGLIASGYEHYCVIGYLNHAPHWLYDEEIYAANAADVSEAALAEAGCYNFYDHYLKSGAREGRIAHPLFDPAVYRTSFHGDTAALAALDAAGPFEHFLHLAWTTRREAVTSPYFDPAWFRATYPDAAAEIDAGRHACALHAYLTQPGPPWRDPVAQFSEAFYRETVPEAATAVATGTMLSGYEHFLKLGGFDLRPPAPGVDLRSFLRDNPDLAEAVEDGRIRDAFAALRQRLPPPAAAPAAPPVPPIPVPAAGHVFTGANTLPTLRDRVFLELEEVIICPPHGLAMVGWTLSAPGTLRAIRLYSGERCTELRLEDCTRHERPDVRDSVGAQHGLTGELRSGFIAHLADAWQPDATSYLEVETMRGDIGHRGINTPRLREMEAIRFLVDRVHVRYGEVPPAFDHVLGPSVLALNADRLRTRPTVQEVAFGTPPAAPAVSVIVTLYGRLDFMEYQFGLLSRHIPAVPVEYIYVLDDPALRFDAENLAASIFARFRIPLRLLVLDRNMGFAPANNIGLAAARGAHVCFMNSDVFVATPDWMERLLARLGAEPGLGAVGPLLLFEDGCVQHQGMRFERVPVMGNWHFPLHERKGWRPPAQGGLHRAAAITGACLMLRRDLALDLGGFDENYVIGDFEDADLCLKLRARGLACAVDLDAAMYHLERQSQAGPENPWRTNLTLFNAWFHEHRWAAALAELDAEAV